MDKKSGLLGNLKPKRGSTHRRKLLGRGQGSGKGQTSGKGHKGQKARSGGSILWGFEGGQMPMARRLPKFGFSNTNFKTRYEVINLAQLDKLGGEITPESLVQAGIIKKSSLLKILGRGELSKAVTVRAHKFSQTAKSAIEAAGGKVEVIS